MYYLINSIKYWLFYKNFYKIVLLKQAILFKIFFILNNFKNVVHKCFTKRIKNLNKNIKF